MHSLEGKIPPEVLHNIVEDLPIRRDDKPWSDLKILHKLPNNRSDRLKRMLRGIKKGNSEWSKVIAMIQP